MRWAKELIEWLAFVLRSVLRGIGRMIVWIWRVCRASWVDVGNGLRPNSLASAAYLFLYAMLFLIGLVLVLLGFNLADVDRWLDRHTNVWELIGTIIMKLFWGALLAGCLLITGLGIGERLYRLFRWVRPAPAPGHAGAPPKEMIVGWGFIIPSVVVGYFAVFGLIY